jgi:linoleoyl-CoA desaturase
VAEPPSYFFEVLVGATIQLNHDSARTVNSATEHVRSAPLKFQNPDEFRRALRSRVEKYFASTGRKPRDCPQMYAKSAIVLGCSSASYVLLVFVVGNWWLAVPLAILLGLSLATAAFNIQHDGGHGAYSDHRWINKLASLTLDLLGGSSYVWARKHNTIHHSYTNVTGHDDDINVGIFGRLSPHQPRLRFHRLQHLYLWALYGLLPIKWHLFDDFRDVIVGRIAGHRFPRPKGWELMTFLSGKAIFFTLAFAIPMLLHPFWIVLSFYAIVSFVQGVVLSVVFQMAHCVEEADFPVPQDESGRMDNAWAIHQVETTVDFARRNPVLSWFIGGLNFQIEHHLFPQICHLHYPALARLVEKTCAKFNVKYSAHDTFFAGIASHYRWLRRMGMSGDPAIS